MCNQTLRIPRPAGLEPMTVAIDDDPLVGSGGAERSKDE
jgi:hypothetical protein